MPYKELRLEDAIEFIRNQEISLYPFDFICEDAAERLGDYEGRLCLDGISEISPESIAHLSKHRGFLSLAIEYISEYGAWELWTHQGAVELNCLKEIPTTAGHIALLLHMSRNLKVLRLNGLTSVSVITAGLLAMHDGKIELKNLRVLQDTNLARKFASQSGDLTLQLKEISDEAAGLLASKKEGGIYLPELESVTPGQGIGFARLLKKMGRSNKKVVFESLGSLTDESAKALSKAKCQVDLIGLEFFGDSSGHLALAQKLANQSPHVDLPNVRVLGKEACKILLGNSRLFTLGIRKFNKIGSEFFSGYNGTLHLNQVKSITSDALGQILGDCREVSLGLTSLSTELAKVLVRHRVALSIPYVKTLSQKTARILADMEAPILSLNGLQCLSGPGHVALARKLALQPETVLLGGLEKIDSECAATLSMSIGNPVELPKLLALPDSSGHVALAKYMADSFYQLRFESLRHLGEAAARALASGKTGSISFGSPQFELTEKVAVALAPLKNTLSFAVIGISASVAKALAAHQGDLELNGIHYLDLQCAEILATHGDHSIELNGLQGIAPDARAALEAHEGPFSICGFDRYGNP